MRRALMAMALLASGCMWDGWDRGPDLTFARMIDQPRVDPYEETTAFHDGVAMRSPPEGSVPFSDGAVADVVVDRALLVRGRSRFEIHCTPCHGVLGDGHSVVAEDMTLEVPPSLLSAEIRARSDDEIEETISEGDGLMPSFAYALDARDRRAVTLYVRALQLRESVSVASLPDAMRRQLEQSAP